MLDWQQQVLISSAEAPVHDIQDILVGSAKLTGPHSIKYNLPGRVDVGGEVTAKDIMLATGSVPFVPPGIPIDGKTVCNIKPEQCPCTLCCFSSHTNMLFKLCFPCHCMLLSELALALIYCGLVDV